MAPTTNILVVDDEAQIRASLKELLTRDGYRVAAVESGEAALECIVGQAFDLALIDLRMKGMGGIELLAELRRQSPDTVVIVLTGHASLETAVETLRQGAHDYLFKPCKPAELRESIRKGLVKRREIRQRNLLSQLDHLASGLEDIRAAVLAWRDEPLPSMEEPAGGTRRFLQRGGLFVDLARHVITLEGHLLDLSPTEFEILAYLTSQSPRVVSAQELVREAQGYESESWGASEIVRQHIYRLRQKLKETAGRQGIIRTVRGVGYTIDE